jgi:hypothetical protein
MAEKRKPTAGLAEIAAEYDGGRTPLAEYAGFMGAYAGAFAGFLALARASGRTLPRLGWSDVALLGMATHKMSRLLSKQRVAAPLRAPFTEYRGWGGPAEVEERPRGEGARRALGELLLCPYCLDQWIAGGFVAGSVLAPRATRLVASLFASVAVADFLQVADRVSRERMRSDARPG